MESDAIALNYLIHEGHKEAAQKMIGESSIGKASRIDQGTISERRAIRYAMECGNIADAITRISELNSNLLKDDAELSFRLHHQQLIELIHVDRTEEAILYAQLELSHRAEKVPKLLKALECTMMLLAYESKSQCPLAGMLSREERKATAEMLNSVVLAAQGKEGEGFLPVMLQRAEFVQNELQHAHSISFPRIDDYTRPHQLSPPCSTVSVAAPVAALGQAAATLTR